MSPRKPVSADQAAYMKHHFGIDARSAPKPPTPAQRGARTRAARAQATRAAAATLPDYTPDMQGGQSKPKPKPKPRSKPVSTPTPPKPPKGSGAKPSMPKPPPKVKVPSAGKMTFGGVGKIALRGLGVAGTALGVAETMKDIGVAAGFSNPKNVIIGPAETKVARAYGPQAVKSIRDSGSFALPRRGATPRTSTTSSLPSQPPAPSGSTKAMKMADYSAAPAGKTGKFLRKAYYTNRLYAMSGDRYGDVGVVSTKEARQNAINKFKQTHAWARNAKTAKQKRDLNAAVTYLQTTRHKGYWEP